MKKLVILTVIFFLTSPFSFYAQRLSAVPRVASIKPAQVDSLPNLTHLEDGWNTLRPGGRTICSQGSEYMFFARANNPSKLLVYLHGGGGCWDAETCDPERNTYTYSQKVEPNRHPENLGGIFNLDHPENPVAGYSMVVLPVCTGDAFLGDRDMNYRLTTETGEAREFTIYHRGQTNTMTVLKWIFANFESPEEILVAGSSAGAVAMPLYANLLARHYPNARVKGLSDDAGSFGSKVAMGAKPENWGIPESLNRHIGWEQLPGQVGIEDLFIHSAGNVRNLDLYQFNHAKDATQRFYHELINSGDIDIQEQIRKNHMKIGEQVPTFRYFTVGGYEHVVLTRDTFYYYMTKGQSLKDWVTAIVQGEPVSSLDCRDDCEQPDLIFSSKDLRIINRALEFLSEPGAWNPQDAPGPCDPESKTYSIRCALVQASQEVTGQTPQGRLNVPPALLEVVFTITAQSQNRQQRPVIIQYNNDPETTAEDMISTLEMVRKRIQEQL